MEALAETVNDVLPYGGCCTAPGGEKVPTPGSGVTVMGPAAPRVALSRMSALMPLAVLMLTVDVPDWPGSRLSVEGESDRENVVGVAVSVYVVVARWETSASSVASTPNV